MKTWQKRISILLLIIIAVLIIWDVVTPPDPKDCSICRHQKCHAPCILNLATGEMEELDLYEPHFSEVGEIAEKQIGGTISFIRPVGLKGIKLTDPWYIEIDIPMEGERKKNAFFCNKCRELLGKYEQGYVLIDKYDLHNPVIYDIEDGSPYGIRCYQISMTAEWEREVIVMRVDGLVHK